MLLSIRLDCYDNFDVCFFLVYIQCFIKMELLRNIVGDLGTKVKNSVSIARYGGTYRILFTLFFTGEQL